MIVITAEYNGAKYTLVPLEDIPLRIDVSTVEAGEIGEIFGDISQDIQFAANEENNRFFNHAFEVGRQDVPGTFTAVDVVVENEHETLMFGKMVLTEWDSEIYTCSIETGTISLEEALEDKLIADADWSDLDHTYSMDTWRDQNKVTDSFPPYFYPFMDLGFDEDGRPKIPNDVILITNEELKRQINLHDDPKDEFGFRRTSQLEKQLEESYDEYGHSLYAEDLSPRYEIIVGPSQYHGDVSFHETSNIQGTITSPTTPFRVDQLGPPAIKAKEVVDRIFEQAGATYSSTAFPMLEDLYIYPKLRDGLGIEGATASTDNGFRARDLQGGIASLPIGRLGVQDQVNTTENQGYYRFGGNSYNDEGVNGQTTVYDFEGQGLTTGSGAAAGIFVVPEDGTYEFYFKGSVNLTDVQFNGDVEFLSHRANIRLLKRDGTDGNVLATHEFEDITQDTANNAEFPYDITYSGTLFKGQRLIAELECTRRRANRSQRIIGNVVDAEFGTNSTPLDWEGQTVDIGAQFQDTKSSELLRGIMQKLNLVPAQDKTRRNHYKLEQYYDWILAAPRLDWTDKISNKQLSPLITDQDATINFADAESDDIFNTASVDNLDKTYGTFVYPDDSSDSVSSETDGDKTIGDFFSPIIPGHPRLAGDPQNIVDVDPRNGIPHLYEAEDLKSVGSGIYMGYSKAVDLPSKFYYSKDLDTSIIYSGSVRTLSNTNNRHDSDINYSNEGWNYSLTGSNIENAYEKYWKQQVEHLYDPNARKLSCDVLLTPEEYIGIEGNETIHIEGNDYLIDNISGWNLSEPDVVKAELVTYQNNFTTIFTPMVSRYVEDPGVLRTFTLGITVTATGDDGETIPGALLQDMYLLSKEGLPNSGLTDGGAEVITETLIITPSVDYDVSASNFTSNAADLAGVELSAFRDVGRNVEVDITCTIQDFHVFHTLNIMGEVDPIVGVNNDVELTYSSSGTGTVTISGGTSFTNNPGVRVPIVATLRPEVGSQLDDANLVLPTVTITDAGSSVLSTDLIQDSHFIQAGTSVEWRATLTIPSGVDVTNATIAFVVNSTDLSDTTDLNITRLTINFQEQSGGFTNGSIGRTQIILDGVQGTRGNIQNTVVPASGYMISASAVSLDEDSDSIIQLDAVQVGNFAQLNIPILFPQANETVTVVVNSADGIAFGADVVNHTINFTNNITNTTLTETSETFSLPVGYKFPYTNTLTASPGFNLLASAVTVNGGFSKTDAGIDTVNLHREITIADTTETITLGGSVGVEPYLMSIDITENIELAKISRSSYTERFDHGESTTAVFTVDVDPTDPEYSFNNSNDVNATVSSNINYSQSTNTLLPNGSIRMSFTADFPSVVGDADGSILITEVNAPRIPAATEDGTTLTWLGPTVPAQGGTTSFRLVTDGMWSARVSGLGPGSDGSTTGMFNFDYTISSATSAWSTAGSFAPVTGTPGEYIINVTMNGLGGDNPQTFVDYGFLRTIGNLEIVSNSTVIATESFRQESEVGARTITLPAGTSDSDAENTSLDHPNWTFYN